MSYEYNLRYLKLPPLSYNMRIIDDLVHYTNLSTLSIIQTCPPYSLYKLVHNWIKLMTTFLDYSHVNFTNGDNIYKRLFFDQ